MRFGETNLINAINRFGFEYNDLDLFKKENPIKLGNTSDTHGAEFGFSMIIGQKESESIQGRTFYLMLAKTKNGFILAQSIDKHYATTALPISDLPDWNQELFDEMKELQTSTSSTEITDFLEANGVDVESYMRS